MIKFAGSASRLAKYPPPTVRPAKALGTLVKVDHNFRCRLRPRYFGHVRGSGLTGSDGEIRSVEEVDEAVARVREEEARDCLWADINGRTAAERPARDIFDVCEFGGWSLDGSSRDWCSMKDASEM